MLKPTPSTFPLLLVTQYGRRVSDGQGESASLWATWDPLIEGPEKFLHPESHGKISLITPLFYSIFLI